MTCARARAAFSARLDGERVPGGELDIDEHLASCAACRAWLASAEQMTRAVRVQPAEIPDLTDQIVRRVLADRHDHSRVRALRWAVALAAAVQLLVALPDMAGRHEVFAHASREMASLDIALAVGFAYAAYRPERARAYVPAAFVLAACLAVTSAVDIASSSTAVLHEVGHAVAVVQAVLLWALGRTAAPRPPLVASGRAG